MKKPNIIFIFSDQQRFDTMGCYGQKLDVTPNLDQMANNGIMFDNAFTCQPVCGPARSCLQTGKYATEIGCYRNNIALPLDEKTIAHHLSEGGYEVGYVGKWHLASTGSSSNEDIGEHIDFKTSPVPVERRGGYKDYWMVSDVLEATSHGYDGYVFDGDMNRVDFKGYRADCTTDFALDFLKSRSMDNPFFLFLSYIEPHHQNDRDQYEGPIGSKEKFKDFEVPGDLAPFDGDWKEQYPDYLGCCNSLDYNVGRILEELKNLNIDDNTVVVYTSDHGSHFKTRNNEYKRSCHESCVHIPLIIKEPNFKGSKTVPQLVSLIDLPPTLLAYAGIEKPQSMQGRPLQHLINDNAKDWQNEVFIQISESQVGRAIRTTEWKYSVRAFDKNGWDDSFSSSYTEEFLYDLKNDPYELNNLVDNKDYEDLRKALAEKLKGHMKQAGEQVPKINPADNKTV